MGANERADGAEWGEEGTESVFRKIILDAGDEKRGDIGVRWWEDVSWTWWDPGRASKRSSSSCSAPATAKSAGTPSLRVLRPDRTRPVAYLSLFRGFLLSFATCF